MGTKRSIEIGSKLKRNGLLLRNPGFAGLENELLHRPHNNQPSNFQTPSNIPVIGAHHR